ncbi:DUF1804 family protein [Aquabacterium sp.]|uniref:DUF1804 family protein n=1 Tax=Aquabacterium sp. TaxID=1872578 RepID=UPI0035C6D1F5
MAYDNATKARVRAGFIRGLALDAAAAAEGVPYNTARNWKRKAEIEGDDWDVARRANQLSSGTVGDVMQQVMDSLAQQFAATLDALESKADMPPLDKANILLKLSDAFVKTMAAAARGNPKLDRLAVAMEVVQAMAAFVAEHYPDLRKQFIDIAQAFGPEVVRQFGTQQ